MREGGWECKNLYGRVGRPYKRGGSSKGQRIKGGSLAEKTKTDDSTGQKNRKSSLRNGVGRELREDQQGTQTKTRDSRKKVRQKITFTVQRKEDRERARKDKICPDWSEQAPFAKRGGLG